VVTTGTSDATQSGSDTSSSAPEATQSNGYDENTKAVIKFIADLGDENLNKLAHLPDDAKQKLKDLIIKALNKSPITSKPKVAKPNQDIINNISSVLNKDAGASKLGEKNISVIAKGAAAGKTAEQIVKDLIKLNGTFEVTNDAKHAIGKALGEVGRQQNTGALTESETLLLKKSLDIINEYFKTSMLRNRVHEVLFEFVKDGDKTPSWSMASPKKKVKAGTTTEPVNYATQDPEKAVHSVDAKDKLSTQNEPVGDLLNKDADTGAETGDSDRSGEDKDQNPDEKMQPATPSAAPAATQPVDNKAITDKVTELRNTLKQYQDFRNKFKLNIAKEPFTALVTSIDDNAKTAKVNVMQSTGNRDAFNKSKKDVIKDGFLTIPYESVTSIDKSGSDNFGGKVARWFKS